MKASLWVLTFLSTAIFISCSSIKIPNSSYDFMLKFGNVKMDYTNKKVGILNFYGETSIDLSGQLVENLTEKITKTYTCDVSKEVDILFEHQLMVSQLKNVQTEDIPYFQDNTNLDILIVPKVNAIEDNLQGFDLINSRFDQNKVTVTVSVFDISSGELLKEVTCNGRTSDKTESEIGGYQVNANTNRLVRGCFKRIVRKYIL